MSKTHFTTGHVIAGCSFDPVSSYFLITQLPHRPSLTGIRLNSCVTLLLGGPSGHLADPIPNTTLPGNLSWRKYLNLKRFETQPNTHHQFRHIQWAQLQRTKEYPPILCTGHAQKPSANSSGYLELRYSLDLPLGLCLLSHQLCDDSEGGQERL